MQQFVNVPNWKYNNLLILWAENTTSLCSELKKNKQEFANAMSWKYKNSLMLWAEKQNNNSLLLWAENITVR